MTRAVTFLIAAALAATLIPAAAFANGGDEPPPPVGPDYKANPPSSDTAALADARRYYDEYSYAWALAAAEELAARWPGSSARAEADLIALRCYFQLEKFAEADAALEKYLKTYKNTPWAADAADLLVDVYSEYRNVSNPYQWEQYLAQTYGYYFYGYSYEKNGGRPKLDRRREQVLGQVAGIYKGLMGRTEGDARLTLADRLVADYMKMYPYFDWERHSGDAAKNYAERGKFLKRVSSLAMSDNMRSVIAFEEGILDADFLPADENAFKASGRPQEEHDLWWAEQRYAAARAKWDAVARDYGAAAGALLARAAIAHYDVTFVNDPATAAIAFDELADSVQDESYAGWYRRRASHLRSPAVAIMGVVANPAGPPALSVELACRIVPEVELRVYAADPAKFLELSRKLNAVEPKEAKPPETPPETPPEGGEGLGLTGQGTALFEPVEYRVVPTRQLPGITDAVASWSVATGCKEDDYRIKAVTGTLNELPPGLYVVEAKAGEDVSRAWFVLTGAAALTAGDGEELFLETVDAVTGAPVPFTAISANNVYYKPDAKGYNQEIIEPVTVTPVPRGPGVVVDLTSYPKSSTLYFVLNTALGPAIYECRTAYDVRARDNQTGVVVTDRPLYRPENTVSFKGILRRVDFVEKVLAPIANQEVELFLYSPDGQELWKGKGKTDDFGTVAGEVKLPVGAKLGTQSLAVTWKVGDREYSARGTFSLEEYEKPEYEVNFTPLKDRYYSGEKVDLDVVGSYYFGAPMAGATLTYEISREGYGDNGYQYGTLWRKGEGTLDPQGRFRISFPTPHARKYDNYFTVALKLKDVSQHIVEETFGLSTYKTDRYLSLSTDKYEYRPDEAVTAQFYTYDWYSAPVAADVAVAVYAYDQYAADGKYRGELLYKGSARTDAEGAGKLVFELGSSPPMIEVVAKVVGSNGAAYETSTTAQFVGETVETTVRKPEIGLTIDNYYPKVGDEVTVNLESRFDKAECLVTIYSGMLVMMKHVTLEPAELGSAASFVLPVEDSFVPNCTLYAEVLKDGESWNTTQYLYVTNPAVEMKVEVKSDRRDYRPGEEATVRVSCADPAGLPLAADMSLAVVDESLLALRSDQTYAVPGTFEGSLNRYGYLGLDNSLRNRGYMGNAVFWFPYYSPYGGVYGTNFLPADLKMWGPAAGRLERLYLPELTNPGLIQWLYIGDADLLNRERLVTVGWSGNGMGGGGGIGSGEGYGAGLGAVSEATTMRTKGGRYDGYAADEVSLEEAEMNGDMKRAEKPAAAPAEGHLGTAGKEDKNAGFAQAQLRKVFADTALWLPSVRTDATGFATAAVKLPDNLTQWRVMALALDKGQRFGWGNDLFNVNKYIIARLKAPRYMVVGDVARLTAIGHNYLPEAKTLKLGVEVEGLTRTEGEGEKTEEVAAKGEAVLYDWVEATTPGTARLVTSALTDVESDAAETFLPVYPHGSIIRQAFAGRLRDEVVHTLTVAEGVAPSSFSAELFVTPSLAATLSHGLDFFQDYPYDCVEQTLNRFRMNALLAAAAADLKLDQTTLAKGLTEAMDEGMKRLGEQQTAEGGWPWWKGGRESAYMTAYALDGLHTLQGNPFLSPNAAKKRDEMFASGEKYLTRYLEDWRKNHDLYPAALSLYITDVALRTGALKADDEITKECADYYFDYRSPHSHMSLALLASVLSQMGDEARLAVILRNLDNGARLGRDNTLHWGEDPENCWRWWDDSVETTAKVLEVKLGRDPQDKQLPYIVDWLVDQRRGAAWKSTKDSATATTALIRYILARPELAAPIVTAYKVGLKEGGMELDPTAYEKPGEKATFAVEDFAVGDNEFKLTRTKGEGPVFYTAALEYYAEAKDLPAVQGSVTLSREYFIVQKNFKKGKIKEKRLKLDRPLKLGEELEVELKINSPYDFDYVVLEDPKPAGFIYLETASGYNWTLDAFVELWNKQRSVLFERLKAGETVVTYRLRAEVPGTFAALPARIYGMYSPDIGSNTASANVEIGEQEQ